jgi:8-oxo-dGTP diphosphatase
MTDVKFYDSDFLPDGKLTYSVIAAICRGEWLFVRHQDRKTWEIPGGHIEEDETSLFAARRELMEETGAIHFDLECVATYSVTKDGKTGYGRLYIASVENLGPVPDISEIAEVKTGKFMPESLTYPDIQPHLFRKAQEYLSEHGKF